MQTDRPSFIVFSSALHEQLELEGAKLTNSSRTHGSLRLGADVSGQLQSQGQHLSR